MSDIRITTENLPTYRFPHRINNSPNPYAFNLIQARERGEWLPRWVIADSDGYAIAILEADSFDGLSPEFMAQKALNYVYSIHGLPEPVIEQLNPKPDAE